MIYPIKLGDTFVGHATVPLAFRVEQTIRVAPHDPPATEVEFMIMKFPDGTYWRVRPGLPVEPMTVRP